MAQHRRAGSERLPAAAGGRLPRGVGGVKGLPAQRVHKTLTTLGAVGGSAWIMTRSP